MDLKKNILSFRYLRFGKKWILPVLFMLFALQKGGYAQSEYVGKPVSLVFQDIQVRAVLQILADFTGSNLVVTDAVNGNITLNLREVPWDQALDIILETQGLDKRVAGNILLIDKAAAISARESAVVEAQLSLQKQQPLSTKLLQIKYAKATDIANLIQDKTGSLLSERGMLTVDPRTNTILLQDTNEQLMQITQWVKHLDIPVQQVIIEARIVNMMKDCAKDIGIRWGVANAVGVAGTLEGANQLVNNAPIEGIPLAERLNLDLAALPFDATPASVGIALAKLGNNILLDLELSALESEGRAQIIARPRLMTTNQHPAVIESGEDIPYQQATLSGATAVSFKKAVLSLNVTPQITPDGHLLMELLINQDSDSGRRVQGVPIVLTKSIKTSVLVNNGQTIVLGGIYKQDKNNSTERVPFLGSLPVVGILFSKKQIKRRNEELLIFITPKIPKTH